MDGPSVLVPIAFFVLIAIVVVGPRYLRSQEQARFTEALKVAFERGQPVPPEVIDYLSAHRSASPPPVSTDRAHQDMRIGVIWLSIGLGLFAVAGMFYAMLYNIGGATETGFSIAAGGCIPFFVGLAFLLLSALGRRHAPSGERSGT
jgi:hypothetical protein